MEVIPRHAAGVAHPGNSLPGLHVLAEFYPDTRAVLVQRRDAAAVVDDAKFAPGLGSALIILDICKRAVAVNEIIQIEVAVNNGIACSVVYSCRYKFLGVALSRQNYRQ